MNKKASVSQMASSSCSPSNKRREEINKHVSKDHLYINDSHLSVGTIIARETVAKHIDYKTLGASDIALVNICFFACGLVNKVFKNPRDLDECYWSSKTYQKKASSHNEKIGYELIGVITDKMIKHATIFSLSTPKPSEADLMIKIWADIFEVLFYDTGIFAGKFYVYKSYALDTANVIKQTLGDEKKHRKSMKRKLQEDVDDEEAAPPRSELTDPGTLASRVI